MRWLTLLLLFLSVISQALTFEYFEDTTTARTQAEIAEVADRAWRTIENPYFDFSDSNFWIRFDLDPNDFDSNRATLQIRDIALDNATLFLPDGSIKEFGELVPISKRDIEHIYPATAFELPREVSRYYLRLSSTEPIVPLVQVMSREDTVASVFLDYLFLAMFFGIMVSFLFYNLFIFIITKSTDYYNYLFFLGNFTFLNICLSGLGVLFVFPEHPELNHIMTGCFMALTSMSAIVFSRDFLNITKKDGFYFYALQGALYLALGWLVVIIATQNAYFISKSSQFVFLALPILLLATGVHAVRKKYPQAYYFLISWALFLVSVITRILMLSGVIDNNPFNFYLIQSSFVLLIILLSIALAAHIRTLQQEKQEVEHRANLQLSEMNQKLEQSNQLKDQFLTNLSHELRTPINGAKGMLQILRQQAEANKQEQYDLAIRSTHNIQSIIEKLLILTESQDGNLSYTSHWFDLQDVLNNIEQLYSTEAKDNRCELTVSALGVTNIQYFSTYEAVNLICSELVENAIKYSKGGKVSLSTQIIEQSDSHMIEIVVQDTGQGMTEDTIANIYTPFWQDDLTNTRKVGGLGIGLTVVNLLVKEISGSLSLESSEATGTKATLQLELPFRQKKATSIAQDLKDVSVLIVEDNKVNQLLLKSLVKKLGCNTLVANNGKEALELVEQAHVDIILMDCQMPIMDGFEATHLIRHSEEAYFNLPIIAVTANTTARDRNHCFEVGMNAFLKKPIEIERLKNTIATYTVG